MQRTLIVQANNDDMEYYVAGENSACYNITEIVLGGVWGDQTVSWFRFTGFPVTGRQATIISAKLYLHSTIARTPTSTVKIYCEDVDNAGQSPCDKRSQPWTTAYANWQLPTVGADEFFYSADFASVLQEVIDRAGFAVGNAVLVIVEGVAGGGDVNGVHVTAREASSVDCAKLVVSWKQKAHGGVI